MFSLSLLWDRSFVNILYRNFTKRKLGNETKIFKIVNEENKDSNDKILHF